MEEELPLAAPEPLVFEFEFDFALFLLPRRFVVAEFVELPEFVELLAAPELLEFVELLGVAGFFVPGWL